MADLYLAKGTPVGLSLLTYQGTESQEGFSRESRTITRDAMAEVVLNQLYRFTSLQTSFGVNMLALNRGKPELLNVKELLVAFLDFREE